ncbi:MAG: hypothetical protein GX418_01935 [Clostridiales bacterium]|nr:hypothetical protein [Clostridiales bacterium]
MPRRGETAVPFSRLLELAGQAERQGRSRFTTFLTPPEAELALAAAGRAGVWAELYGGYEGAERRMARFTPPDVTPEPFPIAALEITWPLQPAPEHRDLLGALMGLGIERSRAGDIVPGAEKAYLWVETALGELVRRSLTEAGRSRLHVREAPEPPAANAAAGEEARCTVASPRLDALVADGFHLSRGHAAELIESGAVKLRHALTLRPDARVEAGDAISVRGYGRLQIEEIGSPTRKGRLPVRLTRLGTLR